MPLRRSSIWLDPRVKPPFRSAQINRAHSLAPDICFLLNEAAGSVHSALGSLIPIIGTFQDSTHTKWMPTSNGIGVNFDGTASTSIDLTTASALWNIPAPFSVDVWWDWQSGDKQAFAGPLNNRVASQNGFQLVENSGVTNAYKPHLVVWNGSSETFTVGETSINYTRPFNLKFLWTFDGTSAKLYVNGVVVSAVGSGGGFGSAVKAVNLGAGYANIAGTLIKVAIYKRVLSASDVLALHTEPYVFLYPIIRRRYFVPPAATGGKGSFFPFFVPGLLSTPS